MSNEHAGNRSIQLESSLDEWYLHISSMYLDRNHYRSIESIFTHLQEMVGTLSLLATEQRKKHRGDPEPYIVKSLVWWFALCAKARIGSVSEVLWAKFPGVCPYCETSPHSQMKCDEYRAFHENPRWTELDQISVAQHREKPSRVRDWQRMFNNIYPASRTEDMKVSLLRLDGEEMAELAEAVRYREISPGKLLGEVADVFAWLMKIQNLLDLRRDVGEAKWGDDLEFLLLQRYASCPDCQKKVCNCGVLNASGLGRISEGFPPEHRLLSGTRGVLTEDEMFRVLRGVQGGNQLEIEVTPEILEALRKDLAALDAKVDKGLVQEMSIHKAVVDLNRVLDDISAYNRATSADVLRLADGLSKLPSEKRTHLVNVVDGLGAVALVAALKKFFDLPL